MSAYDSTRKRRDAVRTAIRIAIFERENREYAFVHMKRREMKEAIARQRVRRRKAKKSFVV